jgi:hypothetical protein
MTYTEEDWIDDEATSHRGPDDRHGVIEPADNSDGNFRKMDALKMCDPLASVTFLRSAPGIDNHRIPGSTELGIAIKT